MLFSDDHAARMLHDDPEGYRRRLDEYLGFGRGHDGKRFARNGAREYPVSPLLNTVVCGDCRDVLDRLPERSVDLVFTSPPYFNARPELGCFEDYEEYLVFLKSVIEKVGRVLVPGRFFVLNIAPVIVPSERRSDESKRLALPFDSHRLIVESGYEFIEDIIWVKPEGAGWVSGRGRRFATDRNALAYKPAPVTEYVLVYRKQSDRLIDWFLGDLQLPERTVDPPRSVYPLHQMGELLGVFLRCLQDLWMWTTNRHLVGGEASQILKHWGFRPVSLLTWVKERVGTGVWLRGQTEHAVLAVRGKPIQPLKPESTLLRAPCTRTHSTKPDAFYELVERICPGSKDEIFARRPRTGWTTWGS